MDFVSPVVGAVTGIEMAQWRDVIVFALKVFLFTLPFVVVGLLVEKDVIRVPRGHRLVKILVVFVFFLPLFLFGILNYLAPGMPEAFWEQYPFLEGLWIMEGRWPPALLSGLALLYLLLYAVEVIKGDMRA